MRLRFAFAVSIGIVSALVSESQAAVLSFLSSVGTVGGGANPAVQYFAPTGISGTRSVYLWVRNDSKLQSLAYNLVSTNSNAIKFTGVTVYTPDLLVGGVTDIGDRWNTPVGPGTISANGQTISNFSAVNVDKAGLDPATRSFDQLYDPAANAALFAKIDFQSIGGGASWLVLSEGSTLIVEGGVQPSLTFNGGTIGFEPEPSSVLLMCFGLFGQICVFRRRQN